MAIPEMTNSVLPLLAEGRLLWPLTSMRIGGPARWLVQPETESELDAIFAWIQTQHLSYIVLGGGTNVLFPDDGFPGVVVLTSKLKGVRIEGCTVAVACGENLSAFAQKMNRVGMSGMEWACGIPGTLGGAVVMNAGTRDGNIASVLSSVRILTVNGVKEWPVKQLEMGYRTSAVLTGKVPGIVLEAGFALKDDDPRHCLNREHEVLEVRRQTQPAGASSGCIFKNPEAGFSAGELLDRAGCKGMRNGAACVSDQHANFIINEGENNADDVLKLIQQMKSRVIETHSIDLEPEVVIVKRGQATFPSSDGGK